MAGCESRIVLPLHPARPQYYASGHVFLATLTSQVQHQVCSLARPAASACRAQRRLCATRCSCTQPSQAKAASCAGLTALDVHPDTGVIASGSEDGTLCLSSPATSRILSCIQGMQLLSKPQTVRCGAMSIEQCLHCLAVCACLAESILLWSMHYACWSKPPFSWQGRAQLFRRCRAHRVCRGYFILPALARGGHWRCRWPAGPLGCCHHELQKCLLASGGELPCMLRPAMAFL